MKIMKSKLFTLIELITVIVVLGILAAIVIPNISSFKEEAEETAILSDTKNIQTAVDMFMLKNNGDTPTKEIPTLGNPQTIETYGMKPDYLRDLPKTKRAKFWLDQNNTVWASMVDSPNNVNYEDGKITWDTVDGAELYKVYKSEDAVTSAVKNAKSISFLEDITPVAGDLQEITLPALSEGTYLVTAIDKFNFESAPTKVGTTYKTYQQPDEDFTLVNTKTPETPTEPTFVYDPINPVESSYNGLGSVQEFIVPDSGRYKLEVWGAEGGNAVQYDNVTIDKLGGKGGYASGEINLTKGQTLYLYVGGKGGNGTVPAVQTTPQRGGWNGGGGATDSRDGGGGGATDIRLNGQTLSDRIIVVGGGGGADQWQGNGGAGGGLTGADGFGDNTTVVGKGGKQTAGGIGGVYGSGFGFNGTLGFGGNAGNMGPGAGGGYYGGGGGTDTGGAGGGSSYTGGVENGTTTSGINSGDGKILITRIQ